MPIGRTPHRKRHRTKAYHWYRRRRAGASEVYIAFVPEAIREMDRMRRRRMRDAQTQYRARDHGGLRGRFIRVIRAFRTIVGRHAR
ncbi:hypothetical protein [Clavibacter sp. VKM Ac-2872]|uniref:hypothetical protein n=1 Tax=Clavibacter sp. VKM Ac-2872 TaxID=2783812 RepID=UPI001889D8D1|nr:hypothetical protein [Clavibacter sp. VKM Ac-2872]MBF4625830.1 hypothetical protein [Clavibacter sp. VKM Ac-2872]